DQNPSPTRRARRGEDLSYLERPKIQIQNHPPQPPLNARFARPSTRMNSSPDTKKYGLLERDRKRRRRSGEVGATDGSEARVNGQESDSDELSSAESWDSTDDLDQNQKWQQAASSQETQGKSGRADSAESGQVEGVVSEAPVPSEPSTPAQEDSIQDSYRDANNTNTNDRTTTEQPITTTIDPSPEGLSDPTAAPIDDRERSPLVPAQVTAIIAASPSRRVVFSPDKQEPCLSIPSGAPVPKLKGILKTVTPVGKLDMSKMVMPTEEEIANNRPFVKRKQKLVQKTISSRMLEARFPGNKSKVAEPPFSDSPFTSSNSALTSAASPAKVLDPIIKDSIEKLKSEDLAVRKETYNSMLDTLRSSKDKTYYDEIQESIRPLTARILIDLDHGDTESVVTLSVYRCLAFMFFERPIAQLFTASEVDRLLNFVLRVSDISENKILVNVALCCLGTCQVPMKTLAPYNGQIIRSIANHLNSRLNSTSATNEGILNLVAFLVNHPDEIVASAQVWLSSLLLLLVHDVPGIRKKALESVQALIPYFIQSEDNRLRMAAVAFMNEHGDQFLKKLDEEYLKASHGIFALRVWGAVTIVLGKDLQRNHMLNPMLKIIEGAFNRGLSKNTDAGITAFKAWTRLIYNFARGGILQTEKIRKLIFRPIASGLGSQYHNRIRLAATNAWMALLYALGPELVKNADEVFFPIIRPLVTDESEHTRDLILRLLTAMFSNTGGAELLEGAQCIAPGSISFADLGLSEARWVRTSLLDEGLECLFLTMHIQYNITDASRDDWRLSSITGLPFLTQPCSRLWESIVRAVRDINLQEKGLKPTADAEHAVSSLLYFIDRVSKSNPLTLVPGDWPDRENADVQKLLLDPEKAGYIIRADIVHYLYTGLVEIMSYKTLVATRYKVRDTIHAHVYDALQKDSANSDSTTKIIQVAGPRDVTLSPMDFILKCWLALGESVQGTHFESSFWQATSTLVDWSANSLQSLRALYRCVGHLNDIKAKSQTTSTVVWPAESHGPISALSFRDFEVKYWSIVAVRLSNLINAANEISEDPTSANSGYDDLFNVLVYLLGNLRGPHEAKGGLIEDDHSQRTHESEDDDTLRTEVRFLEKRTQICLPVWTSLVKTFYRIAQHKRGNTNTALNTLAVRMQECYDLSKPFIWMQPISVSFTSIVVDTMIMTDPKAALKTSLGRGAYYGLDPSRSQTKQTGESVDGVLSLCALLIEQAYRGITLTKNLEEDVSKIPAMQESAILLLEKVINKASPSLVMQWIHRLQRAILLWMSDSGHAIRDLPKETRKAYQARIETVWNDCILPRLLSCATESKENGVKSGFGSVMEPPSTTIRGAFERAQATRGSGSGSNSPAGAGLLSRSSSSSSISSGPRSDKAADPFSSGNLTRLSPLLVAALVSGQKAMVNKTLEFWNESFGKSQTDLEYPEAFVEAMRPLKLVATVSLPGWDFEDSSQTEVPQFSASMSQEALLSLPAELNVRVSASKLMRQKAELAAVSSTSPTSSPKKAAVAASPKPAAVEPSPRKPAAVPSPKPAAVELSSKIAAAESLPKKRAAEPSPNDAAAVPSSKFAAVEPAAPLRQPRRRIRMLLEDRDDDDQIEEDEHAEDRTPTKRKKKIVHTLELDPINKSLVGKSSEQRSRTHSPEGGSSDETEASTPTKQPTQKSLTLRFRKEKTLPAPPVWRLQPPLQPYDPAAEDQDAVTTSTSTSPSTAVALGSTSTSTPGSVQVLGEDFGYASVGSAGSGDSAAASPSASTHTPVMIGTESEATTVDMSQPDQGDDGKRSDAMTSTKKATVEKKVGGDSDERMEIIIEDSQSTAEEKSMSVLSQQSVQNNSEVPADSRSPEQEESKSQSQGQSQENRSEGGRRRGRNALTASASPENKGEPRRTRALKGLVSSSSSSARNLTGVSDESYEEVDGGAGKGKGVLGAGAGGPTTTVEQSGPIESCSEFLATIRRVEEAREFLGKLDSR
ncbi:DNA-binding protein rif1, partial [Mortierella sp. GBA35]